ncbi:MAG: Cell envelope-related transcriptional attenuator [Candidatus Woesebacteria bacterium GW2011_GWB1_40_101]|nr:MAG: Cell envelope-related transcriptional attenuator [Candidatus Woesebacteria bacterium GW2011_GWB1_40_101]
MDELQANSTTEEGLPKRKVLFSRIKRKFLSHVWLARLGILFGILAGFSLIFILLSALATKTHLLDYMKIAGDFISTPISKIKSVDKRVNLLIMGKAGEGHAGADLTDTMIFTSVSLVRPKIVLISVPRDIWIPAIRAKINSAYYWGNQKESDGGLTLAKSTVEEIVGEPVHYGLVLDFNGFVKIIDVLGGINVMVERAFVDEMYPIAGRENDQC